jgi:hypothetical protein
MSQPVDQWRCGYCNEIIGVYEPMIVLLPSGSRGTSRAAERDLTDVPETSFHKACFETARGLRKPAHRPAPVTPAVDG